MTLHIRIYIKAPAMATVDLVLPEGSTMGDFLLRMKGAGCIANDDGMWIPIESISHMMPVAAVEGTAKIVMPGGEKMN